MRVQIRYQFMLPLLAVAVASLLALGTAYSHLARQQTKTRIEKQLQGVATALSESNFPLTDSVLRQMGRLAGATFVLTDAAGAPLASSGPLGLAELAPRNLPAGAADAVVLGTPITLDGRAYFHSSVGIARRPNLPAPSVLHILFAEDDFNTAWRDAFWPPLVVGGLTVLGVGLVVHFIAGRVSRTLAQLGREVSRLAEGDFSHVELPVLNDEVRDLASAINRTASQLAEYETKLRQTERLRTVSMLGAGLAHEMRNAATGCRLAVDLHAEACQQGAADESLDVARRQLVMMESRLQQLLQMGRRTTTEAAKAIDFKGLVAEAMDLIAPAAAHGHVALSWTKPEADVLVDAHAELLEQAVLNLLLNAVEAAAASQASLGRKAAVTVHLDRREHDATLTIADSGDGPSDGSAADVFEPFVTQKSEGVGIGLAVARRVVESFGGTIGWRRTDGWTQFAIELPLAAMRKCHV